MKWKESDMQLNGVAPTKTKNQLYVISFYQFIYPYVYLYIWLWKD